MNKMLHRESGGWNKLFVIPLVVGIAALGYFASLIVKANSTESWIAVRATIVRSQITNENISRGTRRTDRVIEVPLIEYSYSIEGIEYRGKRVFVGDNSLSDVAGEKSRTWIKRFPVGKSVTAYVNPKDSGESILVRGSRPGIWTGTLIVGFCFVVLPAIFICFFR